MGIGSEAVLDQPAKTPVLQYSVVLMSIFKACDIRGRFGPELSAEIAEPIGRAVGSELTGKSVVVGGDVRPSTEPLKKALMRGLVASGAHVLDVDILPTPAFYFAN